MKSWLQQKFIRFLIKGLYNGIPREELLDTENHQVVIKDIRLNKEQIKQLAGRAQALLQDDLLKLLFADSKYLAGQALFNKSQSPEDILAAKLWLRVVDDLEKRLQELSRL